MVVVEEVFIEEHNAHRDGEIEDHIHHSKWVEFNGTDLHFEGCRKHTVLPGIQQQGRKLERPSIH